jgi:glycosyltransferase involved in cell wall biosynthesis
LFFVIHEKSQKMNKQPIVMISSYPPRPCGIATFCEEAREFIRKANPNREVLVISHTDGEGEGVFPIIDMNQEGWWKPVAEKVNELNPYAVHIQHEYGLYKYINEQGKNDKNQGFLDLLEALSMHPTVVEPHTVHGRLNDQEANFIYQMCRRASIVLFKCHYQKWRLDWTFPRFRLSIPKNIMVVPHGARSDRRYGPEAIPALKTELGLDKVLNSGTHIVGLVGWIQANKRWDILTSIWEEITEEIKKKCSENGNQNWTLLAAGLVRGELANRNSQEKYKDAVRKLEEKGLAYYYEFEPRGERYYKVMALCDFIVLPSVDETQSGTLARIIALNKPFITIAPMEGLTSQTVDSEGGLLFTTRDNLHKKVVELACDEERRMSLGDNLKLYLENVVSWEIIARQYQEAYKLAREAKRTKKNVVFDPEF